MYHHVSINLCYYIIKLWNFFFKSGITMNIKGYNQNLAFKRWTRAYNTNTILIFEDLLAFYGTVTRYLSIQFKGVSIARVSLGAWGKRIIHSVLFQCFTPSWLLNTHNKWFGFSHDSRFLSPFLLRSDVPVSYFNCGVRVITSSS